MVKPPSRWAKLATEVESSTLAGALNSLPRSRARLQVARESVDNAHRPIEDEEMVAGKEPEPEAGRCVEGPSGHVLGGRFRVIPASESGDGTRDALRGRGQIGLGETEVRAQRREQQRHQFVLAENLVRRPAHASKLQEELGVRQAVERGGPGGPVGCPAAGDEQADGAVPPAALEFPGHLERHDSSQAVPEEGHGAIAMGPERSGYLCDERREMLK